MSSTFSAPAAPPPLDPFAGVVAPSFFSQRAR